MDFSAYWTLEHSNSFLEDRWTTPAAPARK